VILNEATITEISCFLYEVIRPSKKSYDSLEDDKHINIRIYNPECGYESKYKCSFSDVKGHVCEGSELFFV